MSYTQDELNTLWEDSVSSPDSYDVVIGINTEFEQWMTIVPSHITTYNDHTDDSGDDASVSYMRNRSIREAVWGEWRRLSPMAEIASHGHIELTHKIVVSHEQDGSWT